MGLLSKHYKTPLGKPYNPEPEKVAAIITLIIAGVVIAIWFSSCSPLKKNSKAYERAALGNPVTPKDSANAFVVAKKVVKEKPPKIIPGKTIKLPPVIKPVLDVKQRSKIIDSLTAEFKDRDSISRIDNEIMIADAFNTGYDKGFWDAEKAQPKEIECPPVICPPDTLLQLNHSQLQNQYGLKRDSLIICTTERNIARKEAKNRFWLLLLLGAGLIASIIFHVKGKFKPKNIFTELQK